MQKVRRKRKKRLPLLPIAAVIAVILIGILLCVRKPEPEEEPVEETTVPTTAATTEATINPYLSDTPEERLIIFAREKGLSIEEWPESLLELLQKNPDAEEFVRDYPFRPEEQEPIDLSDQVGTGKVPLLYQWDKRWGYSKYGGQMMALTGCGPTCLSMACLYVLEDPKYTPLYVADFAEDNGYYVKGAGSSWTLISKGAKKLGLKVDTIPPNASRIMDELEDGNLVVCAMGPGDFTTSGHYILLAGAKDGKAIVHDPNSSTNSQKLWKVSGFRDQISMLWVIKTGKK